MTDTYCVYRIVNTINGKCYVGQTVDPKRRRKEHFNELQKGDHHNSYLQNSYREYGRQFFYFEVLERGIHFQDIKEREKFWIAHFDSHKRGYNLTIGGDEQSLTRKTECVWNGIRYESIAEAARACGICLASMQERLKKGFTCDDDVRYRVRSIEYNGIQYPSMKAAAKANGLSYAAMKSRIYRGYKSDADISTYDDRGILCVWNGIEYPTISAAARVLNIPVVTMTGRVAKGYSCDGDLIKQATPIVWNGQPYSSIRDAALHLGVNYSTMRSRIQRGYCCDGDLKRASYTKTRSIHK